MYCIKSHSYWEIRWQINSQFKGYSVQLTTMCHICWRALNWASPRNLYTTERCLVLFHNGHLLPSSLPTHHPLLPTSCGYFHYRYTGKTSCGLTHRLQRSCQSSHLWNFGDYIPHPPCSCSGRWRPYWGTPPSTSWRGRTAQRTPRFTMSSVECQVEG